MDILGLLPLGFLIGMSHALEADHVAAIAAMSDRESNKRKVIARGALWGVGHTLALFLLCGTAVMFGLSLSGRTEAALELVVGVMIIALGAQVLWRIHRKRVHLHVHTHGGVQHLHAHSHEGESGWHSQSVHDHDHGRKDKARALAIGLVHGAAGSAGLMVLIAAATQSLWQSLFYVAVFGTGSILGMAALSAVASVPVALIQEGARWMQTAVSALIGGGAVLVGGRLVVSGLIALQSLGA
jgi:ABC-type nickel/cobalt efflux system permease component RcnA